MSIELTKEQKEKFYLENADKKLKLVSYHKQHFNYYLEDVYISVFYMYMSFNLDFTDMTFNKLICLDEFLDEDTHVFI